MFFIAFSGYNPIENSCAFSHTNENRTFRRLNNCLTAIVAIYISSMRRWYIRTNSIIRRINFRCPTQNNRQVQIEHLYFFAEVFTSMHWYQPVLHAYVRYNFSVVIHYFHFTGTVLIRTKAVPPLQIDTDAVLTRTVVMHTPTDCSAELLVQIQFVPTLPGVTRQLRSLFAKRVKFRVQMN